MWGEGTWDLGQAYRESSLGLAFPEERPRKRPCVSGPGQEQGHQFFSVVFGTEDRTQDFASARQVLSVMAA